MEDWIIDRAALHCQGWAFTSESSITNLIEEIYARGRADERAAVVTDIRKWRDDVRDRGYGSVGMDTVVPTLRKDIAAEVMDMLAWSIDRGDHIPKGGK
jgi:hypothetical protein